MSQDELHIQLAFRYSPLILKESLKIRLVSMQRFKLTTLYNLHENLNKAAVPI